MISLRQCLAECSKRRHLHMSFLGEHLRWPGMSEDHTLISIVVVDTSDQIAAIACQFYLAAALIFRRSV